MSDTTRLDLDAIRAVNSALLDAMHAGAIDNGQTYGQIADRLTEAVVPALVARVRELEAEVEVAAREARAGARLVVRANRRAEAAEATIQRVREWEEMASRGGVITAGLRDALDGGPDTEEADRG